MQITYNPEQARVIEAGKDWYFNSSEQVFQYSGGPGTGKTFIMNEIIRQLGVLPHEVAPMAYVGAAAIVMRMKGLSNAKTIHSWLYTPELVPLLDSRGEIVMDTYFNIPKMVVQFVPKDLKGIKLMVFDEGGTIPYSLKADIESRGIKILVAGDLDQLDPVADKPAYLYNGKVWRLNQIMRQAEGSAIVYLCQRAKQGLPIHTGLYGNDVYVITEDEVVDLMYTNSDVVLCGKNITRDRITKHIRHDILHKNTATPLFGEKVICRKNNWTTEVGGINLTNGLTGTVINNPDPSSFDGKIFRMNFQPMLTNEPFLDIPVDFNYFTAPHDQKQLIKQSRYSTGDKFEFGYSQTVHLSQGSQWPYGMYFEEYLRPEMNNKLNYTALSRFSHGCIYVKQKRKFR